MSGQRKTEDWVNKWNKRLLRLAAAAFVVMLLGRIFRPAGENFSVARDMRSDTITLVPEEERAMQRQTAKDGGLRETGQKTGGAKETVQASGRGTWESIEAFYRDNYDAGESRAFYADLTHDGQTDLIVLEARGDASDYTLEAKVTVFVRDRSGEVRRVYERQMDQSHAGWGWLYLYEENGKDYLVEYDPVLYEGASRYSFSVFYLSGEGEAVQLAGDTLEFDWNGEIGKNLEDQVKALNQKALDYMEHSRVIAAIGEEYFSGFEMCELGQ